MNLLLAFGLPQGPELFFLIVLVVLLFGAKKLPELARGLGQSFSEFKKARDEFDRELHRSTTEVEVKEPVAGTKPVEPPTPQQHS